MSEKWNFEDQEEKQIRIIYALFLLVVLVGTLALMAI